MYSCDYKINTSISDARKESGLTQTKVESMLGLRKLALRDYETGRLKLPVELAVKMANLYNVDLEKLLGLKKETTLAKQVKPLLSVGLLNTSIVRDCLLTDPVIRSGIDEQNSLGKTIFELLSEPLSKKDKEVLVLELLSFMNSLIGSDGKISQVEIDFRNLILKSEFDESFSKKSQKTNKYFYELYLPKKIKNPLDRAELKHFIIWVLFFASSLDKKINFEENSYIEKVSECLEISKFNFNFIKGKIEDFCKKSEGRK